VARLLARLDASPLPLADQGRLDLESELIEFLARKERPPRPVVIVVEADARGEHDTLPN